MDKPRILSIAVRFYIGQTETLFIHKVSEKKGVLTEIESHYDELEK